MSTVTALQILTPAFQNLGVFQQGQSVPSAMADDAFKRLNRMLGGWALQSLTIPTETRDVFTLTAGKGGPSNAYSIGVGGDFNTDKPPSSSSITGVGLVLGGVLPAVEIPRVLYTNDAYRSIAIKELPNALFTGLYYNPTYATAFGTINLWPVPTTPLHQLVLYHQSPLTSFVDLTTPYSLPLGYEEALVYNLERRLAGPYGRALPADDLQLAASGMRLLKRANVALTDMPNDFAGGGRGALYDINVGGPHNGAA